MGQTIAFDTHAYVKRLKAVGFTEEQAEVQAETLADLIDERLATKYDIMSLKRDMKEIEAGLKRDMKEMEAGLRRDMKEMEAGLRHDMKEMEAGLRHDMKEMEMRLTIKLGAIATTGIIIVAALVKLL